MHDLRLFVHDTRTCCIMAQSLFSGRSLCSQPDVLNTSGIYGINSVRVQRSVVRIV